MASSARPIAVIVENAPDARPQPGLSQADVVIEAMAKGGISRFMAIFASRSPAVVGPVRSARHYFVNLASELGAPLVHFGRAPRGMRRSPLPDCRPSMASSAMARLIAIRVDQLRTTPIRALSR